MNHTSQIYTSPTRKTLLHYFPDEIKESEQLLLGYLIWQPEGYSSTFNKIKYQDFRLRKHKGIFWAMSVLRKHQKPISALNIYRLLENKKLIEIFENISDYLLYLVQIAVREEIRKVDEEIDGYLAMINSNNAGAR